MEFEISIKNLDGKKVINFANNTKNFVEVVFAIDGREVKNGEKISEDTKGYAYPPKLEKTVKKMKDGSSLQFSPHGGEVIAYIFEGDGKYKDEDIEKPAFLKHKLVDRIIFKRTNDEPIKIIKIKY